MSKESKHKGFRFVPETYAAKAKFDASVEKLRRTLDLDSILKRHALDYIRFQEDGTLDLEGRFYADLYDYYVQTGDMPYGTAKGRDGDPDDWIATELEARLRR